MFHQSPFEGPLCLAHIGFVAVSAFEAINDIGAVAGKVRTAFERFACRGRGNGTTVIHERAVSAPRVVAGYFLFA